MEYIRLMYDAAKWCTLDRMSYSKFFFDEYRKRLKLCDTSAEDLAKKLKIMSLFHRISLMRRFNDRYYRKVCHSKAKEKHFSCWVVRGW